MGGLLKPVVSRYRGKLSRINFRADAGFANPEVYEYLEGEGSCRARVAWRREVGSVVGEDRVDFIGDGGDQATQEISGGPPRDLLVQFDEGELRRSIDCDDEVELALRGSDFGKTQES